MCIVIDVIIVGRCRLYVSSSMFVLFIKTCNQNTGPRFNHNSKYVPPLFIVKNHVKILFENNYQCFVVVNRNL
jgi:hypothetical protein